MGFPNCETNMTREFRHRAYVADVLSARSAHKTAMHLDRSFGAQYGAQARALRDAALRSARRHLSILRQS